MATHPPCESAHAWDLASALAGMKPISCSGTWHLPLECRTSGSTRRAGSDHHNLSSRDSKVAPHQEDDCSAGGIDLAEQLSTVRQHYNRLLLDMQAIAIQRLPAGMTVSDFAAAAIAGALSPHVEHPWIGE